MDTSARDASTQDVELEEVTPDELYDVVSVLYHSLKEAKTCARYAKDARGRSDEELADFFEEVRQDDLDRAERAEALLATRLADMYDLGEE